ncbi:MAG: HEAT repeat domain-containing protein [Anaerolineae bacterium]|nr:HEAT repeat domain-containing protein [Anaerolineae bacterium]
MLNLTSHLNNKQAMNGPEATYMARILSLDDEPEILSLINLILERAGYTCFTARNNQEAWKFLNSVPIDLFTQDLKRPGTNGWQFFKRMQADPVLCHIPVIMITADADAQEHAEAIGLQVAGYLIKPFKPQELLLVVADVLAKKGISLPPNPAAVQELNPLLRRAAVRAFLRLPNLGMDDPEFAVRLAALRKLEHITGDPSVEQLISALRDENPWVRWIAVYALGELQSPGTVEPLIIALKDESDKVRWAAAQMLGTFGDGKAVLPLIAALQDEDAHVVREAAFALGRIKDTRALLALEQLAQKAAQAAHYGRLVTPAANQAIEAIVQKRA